MEYRIEQDENRVIYLIENDGLKDVKEDIFPSVTDAVTEMNSRINSIKRTTLQRWDSRNQVIEIIAQPR